MLPFAGFMHIFCYKKKLKKKMSMCQNSKQIKLKRILSFSFVQIKNVGSFLLEKGAS